MGQGRLLTLPVFFRLLLIYCGNCKNWLVSSISKQQADEQLQRIEQQSSKQQADSEQSVKRIPQEIGQHYPQDGNRWPRTVATAHGPPRVQYVWTVVNTETR
jgi:hypothetical protein